MDSPVRGSQNCKRTWKQKLGIVGLALLGVWAIFAAWLFATAWYEVPRYQPTSTSPAVDSVMGPAEYDVVMQTHVRPYVYELASADGGKVVVFGAEHTKDPHDPQIPRIQEQWKFLQPTVALIESDLGMMFPAFMNPVRTFGEVGAVHRLARAGGAKTYTWEPADEVVLRSAIKQGFTQDQVALRWVLGPSFSNRRFSRPADPEAFVLDTFAERSRVEPIRGILTSMDEIEAAWRREFPDGPDWRDVSDQYGLPGFLADIDLNRPRDVHLVSCIADLLAKGARVFVIAGSSHAVKIEPALREIVD